MSIVYHVFLLEDPNAEINYCKILNALLPQNIQVIGWAPCLSVIFTDYL